MKAVFKGLFLGFLGYFFFVSSSFAASPEDFLKTPCENTVKMNRVNSFSNELARRWQLAYFADINKIKNLGGRLPVSDTAYKSNLRLFNTNDQLIDKREQQTILDKKEYQKTFLNCLDKKNKIRLERERSALKKDYQEKTVKASRAIKSNKRSFKNKVRSLKVKANKKTRSGKSRKFVKRWFKKKVLVAKLNQAKAIASQRKYIEEAQVALREGLLLANNNFKDQISINQELSFKKSGDQFNPLLKIIRANEAPLNKKAFDNTKAIITTLINRTKTDPDQYKKPVGGVPNVNWRQVISAPSRFGSEKVPLSGREEVKLAR